MALALKIENLSKRYRLGQLDRKTFVADWKRKLSGGVEKDDAPDAFWALRDLNFGVEKGDVIGILGRNGAGKSTLLKILSQITAPSSGRVLLQGRVAALLEVGTGFHPELSGRDNVFLNGAILGMTRREIAANFDEIVAFAGVEKFIDTPVKRYSSGMRVRLAFAVAAHLEAEILIIDEVLAVGDQAFQNKCLGKMSDVARAGRTVLFVSHNAAAVEALCTRGLVLQRGGLCFDGTATAALAHYAASGAETAATDLNTRTDRTGTGVCRITAIELRNPQGRSVKTLAAGDDAEFWLHYEMPVPRPVPSLCVRLHFTTSLGAPVFAQSNHFGAHPFPADGVLPARGAFVCRIPRLPLAESLYRLEFRLQSSFTSAENFDSMLNAFEFNVAAGDFFGGGKLPRSDRGSALVPAQWRVES